MHSLPAPVVQCRAFARHKLTNMLLASRQRETDSVLKKSSISHGAMLRFCCELEQGSRSQ